MKLNKGVILLITIFFIYSCNQTSPESSSDENQPTPKTEKSSTENRSNVPPWAKSANIYEVNLRQYTSEGTFKAFERHLPRLKKMGVDILWLMPIFPVSEKNRKGTLGSYYAVSDYKNTNPDYGSLEDFKSLVKKIHDLNMYVILDWVPNHTGWDHTWITEHPNWYTQDKNGKIIDPINPETNQSWGWTDVADLNYDNMAMRRAMIDDMLFWITDYGIDGFRCDVAHGVPLNFWEEATKTLYKEKPLFMLAESELTDLRNKDYFVMDYGWKLHHLMNKISKGINSAIDLDVYLAEDKALYQNGYNMHFTSNHDENSWNGTVFERMGDAHLAMAVLASTIEGMPLIYSGQESANKKRLEFFEKDTIEWGDYKYSEFYQTLNELKHKNPALWNGKDGGDLIRINSDDDQSIFAFMRQKGENKVIVILNLSKVPKEFKLQGADYVGEYNNIFAMRTTTMSEDMMMNLAPWEYMVLSNY